MRQLCLLSVMLFLAAFTFNAKAAVEAPTAGGKLAVAYDGTEVVSVYDSNTESRYVTSWIDQVGPYNAYKPTDDRRPKLVYLDTGTGIEVPVLDFDGVDDYLITNAFATPFPQTNTIFIVAARNVIEGSYLIDGLDNDADHKIATISSGRHFMGAGTNVVAVDYAHADVFEIFSASFSSIGGVNSRIYVTGADGPANSKQLILGNIGEHALGGLTIGRYSGGGGYLKGQIAEILIYNGGTNTAEREEIEQYLFEKYIQPIYLAVDDFESYADTSDLLNTWSEGGQAWLGLTVDANSIYNLNSMELHYSNGISPYYSSAEITLAQDWTVNNLTTLDISLVGKATNSPAAIYVEVSDGINSATVAYDGTDAVQSEVPATIHIPLEDFVGVDLSSVTGLTVRVGDGVNPGAAVTGDIYIDNIRVFAARCLSVPVNDLNGDCVVDLGDLGVLAGSWLGSGLY